MGVLLRSLQCWRSLASAEGTSTTICTELEHLERYDPNGAGLFRQLDKGAEILAARGLKEESPRRGSGGLGRNRLSPRWLWVPSSHRVD